MFNIGGTGGGTLFGGNQIKPNETTNTGNGGGMFKNQTTPDGFNTQSNMFSGNMNKVDE